MPTVRHLMGSWRGRCHGPRVTAMERSRATTAILGCRRSHAGQGSAPSGRAGGRAATGAPDRPRGCRSSALCGSPCRRRRALTAPPPGAAAGGATPAEHRVCAGGHREVQRQPRGPPRRRARAQPAPRTAEAPGALRSRRLQSRQPLSEGAAPAAGMAAVEAPDPDDQPYRPAEAGQIGGAALVAAVHGRAPGAAGGAAPVAAAAGQDDEVVEASDHLLDVAPWQGTDLGHGPQTIPHSLRMPA